VVSYEELKADLLHALRLLEVASACEGIGPDNALTWWCEKYTLVKKYKENLSSRDTLYDQVKNERIQKANKEVASRKEVLKAQNEMKIPEDNAESDSKIIEQLRNIVDESDKLYYDNLKAQQTSKEEQTEQTDNINNFKTDKLEGLENEDPWLNKKFSDIV
jgi:hypothetical protein